MNILVVIKRHVDGCVLYRQIIPHTELAKEDKVMFTDAVSPMSDDDLSQYDIVQYHKGYINIELLTRLRRLEIKTVVDFDDYWHVPTSHALHNRYYYETDKDGNLIGGKKIRRKETVPDIMIRALKEYDYVTCTTPFLADLIYPINHNVEVFPNAINPEYPIWKHNPVPDTHIRFGWIGGSQHWVDIQQLRGLPNKLYTNFRGKYKLHLFGYRSGTAYQNFADIFTDYGKIKEPVRLFPARPVMHSEERPSYAQYYNYLDVALVPLFKNQFNQSKSELKVIEAGFFKKPVIVSNIIPYTYIVNKDNARLVNKPADWYKHAKFFIENRNAITEYGEKLYEAVQPYDIRNWTSKRREYYKNIISNK